MATPVSAMPSCPYSVANDGKTPAVVLGVEVAISQEEAERGTCVHLGVPIFGRCGACRGRGCTACGGQGITEGERPVTIDVPPMPGRGTTFVMPLTGLGIHNFYLRVRVRVDRAIEPTSGA